MMTRILSRKYLFFVAIYFVFFVSGCTVKAVGDPNRPITINAHVTIDIKGMQNTATSIEDYVSGENPQASLPIKG